MSRGEITVALVAYMAAAVVAIGAAFMALTYASKLFRICAPAAREVILWLAIPQFGFGMLFAFALTLVWICVFSWSER